MTAQEDPRRTVLVTGAAQGIGRATCRAFRAEGARVAYLDLDKARAEAAAREDGPSEDGSGHGGAIALAADVSDEASVKAALAEIEQAFGTLDVLVNNAGICTLDLAVDLSVADWDRVLGVNLRGPFLMAKHSRRLMGPGSAIINVASQAARRAQRFTAHYSASKMGLIGLTRALALEFAPDVRVNAVSPGTIDTEMIQHEVNWRVSHGHDADGKAIIEDWLNRIPLGRFQDAEEIAAAIVFLASPGASAITGDTLNVSCGAVME
ncbi:MAG: SDR family oxidoreductase [Pseudomonadota bacterium]